MCLLIFKLILIKLKLNNFKTFIVFTILKFQLLNNFLLISFFKFNTDVLMRLIVNKMYMVIKIYKFEVKHITIQLCLVL